MKSAINYTKFNMVKTAVNRISDELEVKILPINDYYDNYEPIEWGVNWSAHGTRTIDEARDYMDKVGQAIWYAKLLTEQKIVVDYNLEKDDINDSNREYFLGQLEFIYDRIKNMKDIVWNF